MKNQLKIGSLLSYLQIGVGILVNLLYTPVMIRLLGQSEYGLYNTVASIISILSILSLGFNAGYIRYYSKYKKENDQESIYKLNGLFLIVFSIIGVVAFLCGLFLSQNIDMVFDKGLTPSEASTAKILMLLLAINLAVTFIMTVFSSIISANEKFIFLKLLGIVKIAGGPLVTLPLLLAGYASVAMVTATLCVNLFVDVCYFVYVIFVLKNKFVFRGFEKRIFRSLFCYTAFIAMNVIVDQVNWNLGKFLLGRFKGTEIVAVYSAGYALFQCYMMFSTAVSGLFTPRIHRIVVETENCQEQRKGKFTDLFTRIGRIQYLILALLATGLIFFGKPFIGYWAGDGYGDSYYVVILFVLASTVPLIQNVGIEIQRALNKHQFRSIIYIFMAVLNLVSSIFLCQAYGAVGAAIGTSVALVVANGLIMNIYYHKKCNINILCFWKNILRQSLGLIIPVAFGVVIMLFVEITSVWALILWIGAYSVVYCVSMFFLGMNKYERGLILNPLRKVLGR